jgi:hypothetical protein
MLGLRRVNALTPEQARILAKLVRNEPVSPTSMDILNASLR